MYIWFLLIYFILFILVRQQIKLDAIKVWEILL